MPFSVDIMLLLLVKRITSIKLLSFFITTFKHSHFTFLSSYLSCDYWWYVCCLTHGPWSTSRLLRDCRNDNLVSRTKRVGLYEIIRTILTQRQCHLLKDLPIHFTLIKCILKIYPPSPPPPSPLAVVCLRSVFREVKSNNFFTHSLPIPDVAYGNT